MVQLYKRSPVDLRPLLGVRPRRIAKALGLIASGYALLQDAGWGGPARASATGLLEWLVEERRLNGDPRAWGYEFDVQTRWAFYPAGTPNVIVTTFVGTAFLDWHQRSGSPQELTVALEAADFIADSLTVQGGGSSHIGYVPGVLTLIHNANALGAGYLARVGVAAGRQDLVEAAREALQPTLTAQRVDGLWGYGEGQNLAWVDGFHTAYVLVGLLDVWRATGDPLVLDVLRRGTAAYVVRLFHDDGVPRYSERSVWPIDVHCASSGIDALTRLAEIDERCLPMARRVARWSLDNLYDGRGWFVYQKTQWYVNRIPYIRWSQAHMFRALARLLATDAQGAGSP